MQLAGGDKEQDILEPFYKPAAFVFNWETHLLKAIAGKYSKEEYQLLKEETIRRR